MTAESNHLTEVPLEDLHQPPEGGKGKSKGCLVRHPQRPPKKASAAGPAVVTRTKGHHCSHQWMAQERAESEDRALYEDPAYDDLVKRSAEGFVTGAFISKRSGSLYPPNHALEQRHPEPGEWDPGKGQNFQHYLVPYWHNAHHLVPNRTLAKAIDDAGESDGSIPFLIRSGLLRAEYNLNDKVNMMILPMGQAVADALRLPRHLIGAQGTLRQKDRVELFSHPDYDTRVRSLLTRVIDNYKSLVKRAKEAREKKHDAPKDKLSKDALVSISDTIHTAIKTRRKRQLRKSEVPLTNCSLDSVFG